MLEPVVETNDDDSLQFRFQYEINHVFGSR